MRILVVSNLYPPHYQGGYEVRCEQVAEALARAGHDVCVLTSTYGLPIDRLANAAPQSEQRNGVRVHRWLGQQIFPPFPRIRNPWTLHSARRQLRDATRFVQLVDEFRPEVVSWWSLYGLTKLLVPMPAARGIPDVHWIEQAWMVEEYGAKGEIPAAFWSSVWDGTWGPQLARPLLQWLGRAWERRTARRGIPTREFPNRPAHVCFVSEFLAALHRDAGISFASSEILHGGVPIEAFYARPGARAERADVLRLLFAGQMTADRGLRTVVEALGRLAPDLRSRLTLTVAGGGAANAYQDEVQRLVSQLGLGERVTFLGKVPHTEMAQTYRSHDVLVFASMRDEGLPLTMVEAMLAGCAVVTTGSGGAQDIAAAADLPLFPKGDAAALARLLASLIERPEAVTALADRCQRTALAEFGLDKMMARWVATLERLVKG